MLSRTGNGWPRLISEMELLLPADDEAAGKPGQIGRVALRQEASPCVLKRGSLVQLLFPADDEASCAFGTRPQVDGPPLESRKGGDESW